MNSCRDDDTIYRWGFAKSYTKQNDHLNKKGPSLGLKVSIYEDSCVLQLNMWSEQLMAVLLRWSKMLLWSCVLLREEEFQEHPGF